MNNKNATYLKILAIFDFVLAGFVLIRALIYVFYLVMMVAMFSQPDIFGSVFSTYSNPLVGKEFEMMGGIFVTLMVIILVILAVFAVGLVLQGVFLLKKKNRIFCMVMASVSTLVPILGTLLGSFTLIILSQPLGKELFEKKSPPPIPPSIPS